MRRERAAGINSGSHYTVLFFSAYFIYYAAYCIFSSYTVLFLTERAYSATVCGIITSLTFLANLLMEPVGGYITDTFLPTRRYLLLLIGMISAAVYLLYKIYGPALDHASWDGPVCRDRLSVQSADGCLGQYQPGKTAGSDLQSGSCRRVHRVCGDVGDWWILF